MEETTNYGLKLIEDSDDYTDIFDDHNDSMEIIDTELAKKLESVPVMTGSTSSVAGSAGLVPAPSAGDQDKVLKGNGTWEAIPTMTGAASSAAGSAGLVPAPSSGDQDKVLKGNGTWETIPTMTGAASSAAGSAGLVPAPSSGDQDKVLKGNGTWEAIPTMTGATALTDGTAGMVPAPVAGETGRFLRADGTWTVPAGSGDSQVGIYAIDATIPVSAWVAGTNDYSVVISDQTVVSTMTVLEWGITNETESNPLMLGETDVTVGAGTVTITTDVIPEASWTVHIDLGTDGSNVLEEVAGKADQELLGYREDGNTASRTIADGSFVVWKGSLYKANGSIPQGTAFSGSNLTEVTDGGLNELQSDVESLNDRITPNVYIGVGQVLQDNVSGSFSAYGSLSVTCANGLAVIRFTGKVATSSSSQSGQVVITPAMIKALCPSCPNLTVKTGGLADMYTSEGAYDASKIGYAGRMMTGSGNWQVARVYNTSGAVGAWAPAAFPVGYYISGECYATY